MPRFSRADLLCWTRCGITGNILYGGARRAEETPLAMWTALYPHLPVPTVRFWVIFNNQLRPLPQVTPPTWLAVVTRSLEMATRAATITAMRHLFAQAEIAHLKHGGNVEIRFVAVPNDFAPPKPGVFIKDRERAGRPRREDGRGSINLEHEPAVRIYHRSPQSLQK
jgi:hypothetical protein